MGSFASQVCSFVDWVGGCICKVVKWFYNFVDEVSRIVVKFIFGIEDEINEADNPRLFGECAVVRKERNELEKKERETYNKLTYRDQQELNSIFARWR